jgi:predicted glycogen debranching enzyme
MTREWLCTNGLGSYASGTVADVLTRRYHGLLVAACEPPLGRRVLWSKCDASVTYCGQHADLSANRWRDGTLAPAGNDRIVTFRLDGSVPTWTYAVADALIERRIWMEHGAQQTFVRWELRDASAPIELTLKVYVNDRDYHGATHAYDAGSVTHIDAARATIRMGEGTAWYLHAPGARLEPAGTWYNGFRYDAESERGLDDTEDLYHALTVHAMLAPGEALLLCGSLDAQFIDPRDPHDRERELLAHAADAPDWIQRLTLAADQFIVARSVDDVGGSTVIAGYHWFGDWGRDTMIALPGLTLATGRPTIARAILRTFARFVDGGMLPNNFPDAGSAPAYNSVDAALWYIETARCYDGVTHDRALIEELFPVFETIVDAYTRGTRYGIHVDPADGLLYAGEAGIQLTWMDAKVGDWVVTPRIGKAIEINALWYNALCTMSSFAAALGRDARAYDAAAQHVRASFERFWNAQRNYPYDVLDGPNGNEDALRPNAVYAAALHFRPFEAVRQRAIVDRIARELWTPMGLRSLGPREPAYTGRYGGSPHDRDAAYHRGTAWPFLAGAFARAYANAYGDRARALRFIEGVAPHLDRYGVGTLAEIADGDPPHAPRGCIAQAWSVGEILRTWYELRETQG